jgi:hypothetical protein
MSKTYRINQNNLKEWAKRSTTTNVSYRTQISRPRPLTLADRMNFLPQTELIPTDNMG